MIHMIHELPSIIKYVYSLLTNTHTHTKGQTPRVGAVPGAGGAALGRAHLTSEMRRRAAPHMAQRKEESGRVTVRDQDASYLFNHLLAARSIAQKQKLTHPVRYAMCL